DDPGGSGAGQGGEDQWTPEIAVGTSVLIPEQYVADLNVRLGLYRRLSLLNGQKDVEAFAAELIDRFGPLPESVENLLQVIGIKQLCRIAGVAKIDAGPKGVVVSFKDNTFANPAGLIGFIQKHAGRVRVRPDQKIVYQASLHRPQDRMAAARKLLNELSRLATAENKRPMPRAH
ncbi:MAG: TRCF domain-containing protein, partial [Alphaproteobacteria bacterium]